MRQDSDRQCNLIHSKHYIYKYMLYTYQQVLQLIENNDAYKQKEPTGKKRGTERKKDRQRDRKKDRKKGRKKERKRQDSDKDGN